MQKQTIWIINQYAGSPKHGQHFRFYYIAKECIKKGHQVILISSSFTHLFSTLPTTKNTFTQEIIDGIHYIWVKVPHYKSEGGIGRLWNMLIFWLKLFFLKTSAIPKPDKIIISSPSLLPIINGYIWKKKYNAKLIFDIRDLWPLTLIELKNMSHYHPLILLFRLLERFGYTYSDAITSTLNNSWKYMVPQEVERKRFHYIPMGYTPISTNQSLEPQINQYFQRPKFRVGYLGSIGISNHIEHLLECMHLLKNYSNIECLIVGKGKLKSFLQKKYAHHSNIIFIPFIKPHYVAPFLKKLDCLYKGNPNHLLYNYGISPIKLAEYMMAEKPIIHATNVKDDPVALSGCGIITSPDHPQETAEALLKIKAISTQERYAMGEKGKTYVLKHFNYTSIAEAYLKI